MLTSVRRESSVILKNSEQCTPGDDSLNTVFKNEELHLFSQCKISCSTLTGAPSGAVVNVTVSTLVLHWLQLEFINGQADHRDFTDIRTLSTATFTALCVCVGGFVCVLLQLAFFFFGLWTTARLSVFLHVLMPLRLHMHIFASVCVCLCNISITSLIRSDHGCSTDWPIVSSSLSGGKKQTILRTRGAHLSPKTNRALAELVRFWNVEHFNVTENWFCAYSSAAGCMSSKGSYCIAVGFIVRLKESWMEVKVSP